MDISSINDWSVPRSTQPTVSSTAREAASKPAEPTVASTKATEAERDGSVAAGVSRGQLEDAVSSIQEFVQSVRRDINFSLDDGSGRIVVKVTDAASGDVIRQIPSEEALKLAESLSEMRSLLFKTQV
ncbi:flagellar protein FlaG [Pseudomonas indica]|jgi:flagellar protein FlaG|uniref:Flagellar protein FlaG n=1 Tax=Pseudomonas indica TaxID=137658 RepID=A0A1G9D0C0_9PSED|nr:flagellar biosynthesis protein FlaG [Pseudomonas indica]SDK57377.1 flagellar protein FlaG [Pseudomonas indica]